MKYKAIKPIGEYKVGDEIPTEKAEVWMKMYSEPHIEIVGDKPQEEPKESNDVMLEDYLGRNTNVVKNNILSDKLSKIQLEKLLQLEKSDKNRIPIIKAIQKRIGVVN